MAAGSDASSNNPDAIARLLRSRVADQVISLPVSGTSMSGVISAGAEVHVSAGASPRRGEIWAFVDGDSRVVVHRVRHINETSVICRGSGNSFDDEPVARTRLIGRVESAVEGDRVRSFGSVDRLKASLAFRSRRLARKALDRLPWA